MSTSSLTTPPPSIMNYSPTFPPSSSSNDNIDSESLLSAYFDRINLPSLINPSTRPSPSLSLLSLIYRSQLQSIAFENYSVLMKEGVPIDPLSLHNKLVNKKRGGYCFEQNGLLGDILKRLGFIVRPILARVRWNKPIDVITNYTHICLLISIPNDPNQTNNEYLVDSGFGGLGPLSPLNVRLLNTEQKSLDGLYRFTPREDRYTALQWLFKGAYTDLYLIRVEETAVWSDLIAANWYMHTHPEGRWMNCFFTARVIGDGERHHILNNEYVIRKLIKGKRGEGDQEGEWLVETEKKIIENHQELHKLIKEVFYLSVDSSYKFPFGPKD